MVRPNWYAEGPQGSCKVYGDDKAPLDQHFTMRFRGTQQVPRECIFDPTFGTPFPHWGDFREASPTGRPGGRQVEYRLPPQELDAADTRGYIFGGVGNPPVMSGRITAAVIDPWGTVTGKVPGWLGQSGDGRKITG